MSAHHRRAWCLAVGLLGTTASAGNYGYFVTYNSKVERGELELMSMNDLTQPSAVHRADGQGTYLSHMVELEYGISDQLVTELMLEWFEDLSSGARGFGGFRWETRYRLFEREVPLNPMVYVEYEDLDPSTRFKMEVSGWARPPYSTHAERAADRERVLETRLVLSEDIGPVNVAVNWINETDLDQGFTQFGYAIAAMWMVGHHGGHAMSDVTTYSCAMHPEVRQQEGGDCPKCGMTLSASKAEGCSCKRDMHDCHCGHCSGNGGACPCGHAGGVGVGLELYGAFGDSRSFRLDPSRQEHYFGPILMYHFTSRLMMHTQLAIGLTKASDNLVRLNFGYDF